MTLKDIIDGHETPAGRAFDLVIQTLIVASLVAFAIETLPGLDPSTVMALERFEAVVIGVFTAEYVLRLVVAEQPWRFARSFFGVVDLAAILPFYLTTGLDLRSVRVFRLLRLIRTLKLVRYNDEVRRFARAFALTRDEMILFFVVIAMLLFLAGVGIYYFEHPVQPETFASIFHGLWWAVATLTTVGYGDIYPITVGGRVFTFFVLMVGLAVVAVPAALFASALTEARRVERTSDEESSSA